MRPPRERGWLARPLRDGARPRAPAAVRAPRLRTRWAVTSCRQGAPARRAPPCRRSAAGGADIRALTSGLGGGLGAHSPAGRERVPPQQRRRSSGWPSSALAPVGDSSVRSSGPRPAAHQLVGHRAVGQPHRRLRPLLQGRGAVRRGRGCAGAAPARGGQAGPRAGPPPPEGRRELIGPQRRAGVLRRLHHRGGRGHGREAVQLVLRACPAAALRRPCLWRWGRRLGPRRWVACGRDVERGRRRHAPEPAVAVARGW
jgi:hypothetical protein